MARDFMPKSSALMPYIVVNRDAAVAGVFTVDGEAGSVDLTDKYVQIKDYNQRVGSLEARVTTTENDIKDIKTTISTINSSIGTINTSLSNKAAKGVNSDITSLTALSGPLRLGGDAVNAYDAITLRQLQASSGGSGGASLNGVMNNFIGAVEWFNGTRGVGLIPAGHLPADGQLLKRADYPDVWAAVAAGVLNSVTEALWQDSGASNGNFASNRGMYSTGDGSTTFRMPDLNGSQSGSTSSLYLRGTSSNVNDIPGGTTSDSAAPNIIGGFNIRRVFTGSTETDTIIATGGVFSKTVQASSSNWNRVTQSTNSGNNVDVMSFDASKSSVVYGRDNTGEIRPRSAWGIWLIRVSGSFVAANTSFDVITGDKTAPSSGVITYGGSVNSTYQVAGANYSKVTFRSKTVIGGNTTASVSLVDSRTSTPINKEWTFPQDQGEMVAIVDSGSNSNGNYVKYSDGTMVCWSSNGVSTATTTSAGSIYVSSGQTLTYPAPFVGSLPRVSPASRYGGSSSLAWSGVNTVGLGSVTMNAIGPVNGATCILEYIAIGRWK